MTDQGAHPSRESWTEEGPPREEEPGTGPPPPGGSTAVDDLLEEVGNRTEPEPLVTVGGLRARSAIVTGASSGIGRAIAVALARSGANIAFNFLDEGEESRAEAGLTAEFVRSCGVGVFHRSVDCRDSEGVERFVREAAGELDGIHILVNNAGIGRDRALWRMTDDEWDAVLRTNLTGAFYFLRAVAPIFRSQEDGKVVNVASVHGIRSEFGLANYSASKGGLIALTRSAAIELGPANVNVNAVAPGYIRTTRLTERVPAEILDRARERSSLGRLGDPQDVAGTVLFLCSEAARHITGAILPVDGGYLL